MIQLQKLDFEYIQLMRKWRNKDRGFFVDKNLITHKDQEKWYKKYLRDPLYWYFVVFNDETPIGVVGFSVVNKEEAHIESIILGEKKYSGRGYMDEALDKLVGMFPFNLFSLKVLKDNKRAIRFYEKNGFNIVQETDVCYIMHR